MEITFWFAVLFIVYAYFGYPLLLLGFSLFRRRRVDKGDIRPCVSFIITAYNEEKRIREKIENTLAQNYPEKKLEIIVASDCSSDRTDEIVKSYKNDRIKLVRTPERKGKENAQKCAVLVASGEILIFSDTATVLKPDGVFNIIKNFNDPTVGCVSSVDKFIDSDGKVSGEGLYVKYEMYLRKLETNVNTLVGLSGSFFAARKEVCRHWPTDLQSDFNTLLNSIRSGYRGICDPESIGYYTNLSDEKKEYDRKVRTVLRGISVFMMNLELLNSFTYGLFSWQIFSHKLCRWMVPFAMITALLSNAILALSSSRYLLLFIFQGVGYLLATVGILTKLSAIKGALKIPSFFVMVNLSVLNAWFRYIRGERIVLWDPSKR